MTTVEWGGTEISRNAETLQSELVSCDILKASDDAVSFKYKYTYYYFVASWIRDHILESDVRSRIRTLSRSLYIEEHANILLFLAHLSKDPIIVQEMVATAQSFYPDTTPTAFADDVEFLLHLGPAHRELVYQDTDNEQRRKQHLESLDEQEAEAASNEAIVEPADLESESAADILNPIITFSAALKTLEILGQILKNFPGSLEGAVKLSIAQECYSLGFRTLASVYDEMRANQVGVLDEAMTAIRASSPRLRDDEIEIQARKTIVGMAELLGFLVVRIIAVSVGSAELTQTYMRIEQQESTPAVQLVNTSISLDQSLPFPTRHIQSLVKDFKNRPVAHTILATMVLNAFNVFPISTSVKQRVCAELGIKYTQALGVNPTRKLLPPG